MPNLAFHLQVLDKVIDELNTQSDPRGTLMSNNKKFAALGALGPDLLRYLPISVALSSTLGGLTTTTPPGQISASTLTPGELQELFLKPVGAIYSLVFSTVVVPNWITINQINTFLDTLDQIAASHDELAIPGILGELSGMINNVTTLGSQLTARLPNVVSVVGQIIALPPWMEQTLTIPVEPADPHTNRLSEFLRWHGSGTFAQNLLNAAGSDEQKAFALGWLTHLAGAATGEPFINNITGGPYRTHWWRNRLVSNFVDSWSFGFFETGASMSGDQPMPAYSDWKRLCSANLQHDFNVAGLSDGAGGDVPDAVKAMATGILGGLPSQFPADIAALLETVVNQTYPAGSQPIAGFTADTFKEAFVGAFAVYWFMTSGSGPMGANMMGSPPAGCATPPSWLTSGSAPSPQQAGVNTGAATCAVVFAILALLAFLFGDIPGGLAALAAALAQPIIDWDTVTCNLFWIRTMMVTAENGLRDALVRGGLAYPPPDKLGTIDVAGGAHPALDMTSPTGVPLTKSNPLSGHTLDSNYPRMMDTSAGPADVNFGAYPDTNIEVPRTANLIPDNKYPDFVVNGAGLHNGGLTNVGAFPSSDLFFGDAVANAVALIVNGPARMPDYNLDADRGDGWGAWHPQTGTMPSTPLVTVVAD